MVSVIEVPFYDQTHLSVVLYLVYSVILAPMMTRTNVERVEKL